MNLITIGAILLLANGVAHLLPFLLINQMPETPDANGKQHLKAD